jgi:hypothetical protein
MYGLALGFDVPFTGEIPQFFSFIEISPAFFRPVKEPAKETKIQLSPGKGFSRSGFPREHRFSVFSKKKKAFFSIETYMVNRATPVKIPNWPKL